LIRRRIYGRKAQKFSNELSKETSKVAEKKEGTVVGAVALIIGTSIGTGILALPEKAFPAVLPFLYHLQKKDVLSFKISKNLSFSSCKNSIIFFSLCMETCVFTL